MQFTIRHAIPGRIRIQMPALEHASALTLATLAWLRAQEWVVNARINHDAASLIVEYDPAHQDVLDGMLMVLRHADIIDLRCLVAGSSPVSVDGPAIPTPDAGLGRDGVTAETETAKASIRTRSLTSSGTAFGPGWCETPRSTKAT